MKKIISIVIALVVVAGGSFYGGMQYQQSKSPFNRNLSQEQRQQIFQGNVGGGLRQGVSDRGAGSGFLSGEVIAKDNQSLTLKMMDGSSKIIFFSGSTQISKTAEGSITDIEIGKQIMITGQQNSDGSYTAKTIQLSPR